MVPWATGTEWTGQDCWIEAQALKHAMHSAQGGSHIRASCLHPGSRPLHPTCSPALTALLLIALVKAVRQPVALPGARDAAPVATHEVAWNVALVGEVVSGEQLALWRKRGQGSGGAISATQLQRHRGDPSSCFCPSEPQFPQLPNELMICPSPLPGILRGRTGKT